MLLRKFSSAAALLCAAAAGSCLVLASSVVLDSSPAPYEVVYLQPSPVFPAPAPKVVPLQPAIPVPYLDLRM